MTSGPISFFLLIQLIIFCTLLNNSNSADFKSVASMCTGVNGALKLYNFIYSGEERRKTPGQAEKLHAHTTSCPQRLKHHPHAARTHCYLRSSGCAPHQSGTHLPHALLCCPQHCQAPSHSWAVAKGFNRQYFFFLDLSQKLFHIKETTDVWISKGSEFAQFGQALKHSQFYSSHPAQDLMAGGDFLVRFLVLQLSVLVGSIGICSYPYKLKTSLNISVLF